MTWIRWLVQAYHVKGHTNFLVIACVGEMNRLPPPPCVSLLGYAHAAHAMLYSPAGSRHDPTGGKALAVDEHELRDVALADFHLLK